MMEQLDFLTDLLVVFIVAGAVVFLFERLRLPAIVGLLIAGVLVGPYGLKLVREVGRVELLAEIGVVVLLFTVGLEFSLSRLWRMWPSMLTVGLPQVAITGIVPALATAWYLGSWSKAAFAGMLIAMSSTAVVLKLLSERNELAAPQGRIAVAVLLLQDLLVMIFMIALPLLGGGGQDEASLWLRLLQGLAAVCGVLVAARYLVPPILYRVMQTRSRELFLSAVVVLCLGTAWLTAWSGLSLTLGAFLAGIAVSDSEYAQQALAEVMPFRDTLSGLFFVSVGMLLDVGFVSSQWALVLVTVCAIMVLKLAAVALPTWLSGYPLRIALLTGMALLQVGEFSFVLASHGMREYQLLAEADYQTFLAAAVITMTVTPFTIEASHWLVEVLPSIPGWRAPLEADAGQWEPAQTPPLEGHVIIAGYGVNGRNVARVLRDVDISYVALDLNPVTVRQLRQRGETIYFGDCSRPTVLKYLEITRAKLLVIAISDPQTTRRAVRIARQMNPELRIIVRTRYLVEVNELRRLGADEIIPEEFETSVEIFARVLEHFRVPRNLVLDLIDRIRRDHYEILRESHSPVRLELPIDLLAEAEVESCLIRGDSPCVGRTLRELDLRGKTGATVIAVSRDKQRILNPAPDVRLLDGDLVFLLGDSLQVGRALALLDPSVDRRKGRVSTS